MTKKAQRVVSPLTLPLAEKTYPFELSEAESRLKADGWAWLFLRLNPFYRHDYRLFVGAPEAAWLDLLKRRRQGNTVLQSNIGLLKYVRGDRSPRMGAAESSPGLSPELAGLDCRYFSINKQPLTGPLEGLKLKPLTLAEYLAESTDQDLLQKLTVRDFDAPRDYGIGAWHDPDVATLAELPEGCSWFFHATEPIWQANTWAIRKPRPIHHVLPDGKKIQVGSDGHVFEVNEMRVFHGAADSVGTLMMLSTHKPIPPTIDGHSSTKLEFLVSLDGYVKPQVARILPIAEKLKARHRQYFPSAVKRGAIESFVPTVFDPDGRPASEPPGLFDLLGRLRRDPSAMRRHWRHVCIDVAAPLVAQFKQLTKELESHQRALADQLVVSIRQREGRKGDGRNHWLKKALAAIELHLSGGETPLSQASIARAFFDPADPNFWIARGSHPPPTASTRPRSPLKEHDSGLAEAREAFECGRNIVLGWYEFVASPERP